MYRTEDFVDFLEMFRILSVLSVLTFSSVVLSQISNIQLQPQPYGVGEYLKLPNGNPNYVNICSREISRKVRFFIETIVLKKFIQSFDGNLNDLPDSCILKPQFDYYVVSSVFTYYT